MRRRCFCPDLFAAGVVEIHRSPVRRGVTLLEVMFSIGIVAVGLLGVLIIVPLAGLRTTQGTIADGADRLGRSAIRAFDVYQMRRPDAWAQLNPVASANWAVASNFWSFPHPCPTWTVATLYKQGTYCRPNSPNGLCYVVTNTTGIIPATGLSGTSEPAWPTTMGTTVVDNQVTWYCVPLAPAVDLTGSPRAICIDPLYIGAYAGTEAGIHCFPYFPTAAQATNVPCMLRVSLRRFPAESLGGALVPPMTVAQAGQAFLADDDLVFRLPTDRTLPARQVFHGSWSPSTSYSVGSYCQPTVPNGFGYRATSAGTSGSTEPAPWPTVLGDTITDGGVTWECRPLVKRQWEGKFSWLATLVPKPGYSSDTYLLSIVVFHRRESMKDAERVVDVSAFNSSGYNGGDVVLHADPLATPAASEDDLKMKEGEWLMLAGIDTDFTPWRYYFKWYRIQTADAGPTDAGGGAYDRDLTLFGQDWPGQAQVPPMIDVCKAVWIPGVVAVYEKTIRLETSSLWTGL